MEQPDVGNSLPLANHSILFILSASMALTCLFDSYSQLLQFSSNVSAGCDRKTGLYSCYDDVLAKFFFSNQTSPR